MTPDRRSQLRLRDMLSKAIYPAVLTLWDIQKIFDEIDMENKRNKHMMCPLCGYDLDGQDYSCTNIYHCHYGRI